MADALAADCAVTGLACACLRVTRPYSACFWADALPTRLTLTNKAVRVTLTRPHGFLVSLRMRLTSQVQATFHNKFTVNKFNRNCLCLMLMLHQFSSKENDDSSG